MHSQSKIELGRFKSQIMFVGLDTNVSNTEEDLASLLGKSLFGQLKLKATYYNDLLPTVAEMYACWVGFRFLIIFFLNWAQNQARQVDLVAI